MRPDFSPVPFYCEENIYRFFAPQAGMDRGSFAVFVSNKDRRVALREQRASSRPDGLVIWDYHVFAVRTAPIPGAGRHDALVFDFDTRLSFPCPFEAYIRETFPTFEELRLRPRFRLVPAAEYCELLVSDRSHMRGPSGRYFEPPPSWPHPGEGTGRAGNLSGFIDMDDDIAGEVVELEGLRERFIRTLPPS